MKILTITNISTPLGWVGLSNGKFGRKVSVLLQQGREDCQAGEPNHAFSEP